MIGVRKTAAPTRNPYVGPRPFRSGDTLHGRGRELRALRDVLIAERIVLLHSPSGAGKTSLIQASLTGALASKRFDVIGPLRVNAQPPNGEVNRYLWSVLLGLDGLSAEEAGGSVANALDLLDERDDAEGGRPRRRVLVLDQFEEVLTLVPTDRSGQEEFFRDIRRALEKDHRWALFSMREDYMGGLARFAVWIPTHLRVRCRLDFLEESAALDAVRNPAREREVEFTTSPRSACRSRARTSPRTWPGRTSSRSSSRSCAPGCGRSCSSTSGSSAGSTRSTCASTPTSRVP
jgi:hypothetical protein